MIMSKSELGNSSLEQSSNLHSSFRNSQESTTKATGSLLQQRLALVEDLWETVLRSEYPSDQIDRVLRLKQLSNPVNCLGEEQKNSVNEIVLLKYFSANSIL